MLRGMVKHFLDRRSNYEWSLQGFGMLRAYVTRELRLHVWDSRYAIPMVSTIHDHPWNFTSKVISGEIRDQTYRAFSKSDAEQFGAISFGENGLQPYRCQRIICGPRPTDIEGLSHFLKAQDTGNAELMFLMRGRETTLRAGGIYYHDADDVHSSWAEEGTITLIKREFLANTEHARVFWPTGSEWVSAEPRKATAEERDAIIDNALKRWNETDRLEYNPIGYTR